MVDEWDGDLTAKELERGVAAIICLVGQNGQDKEEGEKWYLWEGPLWRSVRPIFCSPTPFFILLPLPRSSDILSITFPRPRPLVDSDGEPTPTAKGGRDGGAEGVDNALTKGSKRAVPSRVYF